MSSFPASALTPALTTVLAYNNFLIIPESGANPDFSHKLEAGAHNSIHNYIGGTMGGGNSPLDPMFFLHHAMIDKLWQTWEDNNNGLQSIYPSTIGTTSLVHYMTPMYPFNVISNDLVDSRSLTRPANAGSGRKVDVWYASNKKVLLDGTNGSPFVCTDNTKPYIYRYVAATGTAGLAGAIYVGDVKRDAANNILTDDKGGFKVNSGVTCEFKAGAAITFMPGFEAKSGSIVDGRMVTTANSNRNAEVVDAALSLRTTTNAPFPTLHLMPNPFSDKMVLQYVLPIAQVVSLTIQDLNGHLLTTVLTTQATDAGTYNVTLEGKTLTAGVYLAVLDTEQGPVVKRLVKE